MMQIIVLHGDDSVKSYERLMKFVETAKKRNWEIINDQFPNTPSLFGVERLIVFRDFKLLTKQDIKNFDRFDGTLVIYHDGVLPQTFLKMMPKDFKMEKFDVPKLIFVFLESLYPGNGTRALSLLHEVIKTEPIELVMYFIAKQFHDLFWVTVETKGEPLSFPSWRANKLKSQAVKFDDGKIKEIISKLSDIDMKVKSSKADLLTELDLLIVKQLE